MLMRIKRLLNRFGYDVKRHRPTFDTTVKPLGIRTVLDIGANTGKTAREFRTLFPKAHILSFEPLPGCFAKLEESMKGDPSFKAWNIALGDARGETTIEESSFHPSSSLLRMTDLHKRLYPKSAGSITRTVRIERLDDVLKGESLEPGIFVKMDVQGFEDKVIRGGTETLKKASAIQVETSFVQLYEGQPLFSDIHDLLSSLGFSYYGDLGRHYSKDTDRLIYEESLFVRKDLISI